MTDNKLEEEYQKMLQAMVEQLQDKLYNGDLSVSECEDIFDMVKTRAGYSGNEPAWSYSNTNCYGEQDWSDSGCSWQSSSC